ncbi:MAG: CRTAC1 family protein [Rhodothermales bacterium]|nr:CRTAC1 family protein [Rhodothermales bacterium]
MHRLTFALVSGLMLLTGCGSAEEPAQEPASSILFTEVTQQAGLAGFSHYNGAAGDFWFPETMGAGAAVVDVNDDGWQDLVLVAGGGWGESSETALQVWMNERDGTFVREPSAEPRGLAPYGFGVIAGDLDRDGDADLVYTSLGRDAVLRNDSGRFVDVTREVGVSEEAAWSTAAAMFDADGDGWLDLYIGKYVDWTSETDIYCSQDGQNKGYCTPELYPGTPGQFYLNRGDGTFMDRTEEAGFGEALGKTLGALVLDHNRDGLPDLMLANDTEPDELYLNRGQGTFEEVGVISGVAFDERGRARAGMGINSGVVDDTGEETIFVGNFSSEMMGVYRHLGNDVFLDRAASSRIGQPSLLTLTFGIALADFDLDGDLDLFAANGHVQPQIERVKENIRFRQPPHAFQNQGDGTFADVWTGADEGASGWLARAVIWLDYDNDGDPDLLLTENGGPVHLLRNDASGESLTVRLDGRPEGARVRLFTDAGVQERFVRAGESYLGQSQIDPVFGLGSTARVDSLVVHWASGAVSRVVAPEGGEVRVEEAR